MGRPIKKLNIIASALIMGLLLIGLCPQPALADDPPAPTNLQLESVKVCRHLIENDDFLFVFHYNIHYDADQPSQPANMLFTFRLLSTNGVDYLGAIVPYAYYNSGYDQGCAAFYFSKAQAQALGLQWGGAYIVRISGNPEYFSSPPLCSRTLVLSDYSQDTMGQKENQTVLGNYILDVARKLEINWGGTTLIYVAALGPALNSNGEAYFRGAISALQLMAPQIFPVQTGVPQYEETEWTEAMGKSYETRFEDSWVGKALEDLGEMLHVKWNVITGMIVLAAIIALAIWCQAQYGTVKPVMIGGPCLILGGTVMGWVAPAIMAIVTIFMALFLGYIWMFRHG